MRPKVSLAIPVYNGAKYIAAAINSILRQDYENFELIITDNASTDSTGEICTAWAQQDSRIRYVLNPVNLGAAPNYNRGYELAEGEYVKWCAHDDLISPNYLSACVAALEADSDASLAFGRTQCIDTDGHLIEGIDATEMEAILDSSPARRLSLAIARSGTCFPIFGVFRKSVLDRTTLHRLYYGSDRALIAEIALLGRCLMVNEAIFYNREHPKRSIRIVDHAQRSHWQNGTASRRASMEHVNHFMHLVEIARRHPNVVAPSAALLEVAKLQLTPRQVARLGLDVLRYVSPSAGYALRRAFAGSPDKADDTAAERNSAARNR